MHVPSNGACLFNSVSLAIENTIEKPDQMRNLISSYILQNPQKYNKKFLDDSMQPTEYAEWITNSKTWGGIPEIKIFSEHYKMTIYVVDIPSLKLHKFGDFDHLKEKVFLIFDGTHYNVGICT